MLKRLLKNTKAIYNFVYEFFFLLVLSGLFFFVIEILNKGDNKRVLATIVIIIALAKVFYFMNFLFKKINLLIKSDHSFQHFSMLIGSVVLLVILSFTADYLHLFIIYNTAFANLTNGGILESSFDLFYFSTVTFTTVGYGDIYPTIGFSKLLVMLEIITAFTIITFVLSKIQFNIKN